MPRSLGTLGGRTFAAVLFDMDGTLIDSIPAVVRSWVRWADEHGVDPRRLQGFHGVPARGVVAAVLPPERVDAAFDRIEEIEAADTEGITVLPGALAALAALSGEVERCAIATSCTRPLADARLAETRLPTPRVVVTASAAFT
jgi:sugar-phosphatase